MLKKLNLGCGRDVKRDYVNLDIIKLNGVDYVHDINKPPYPFKNNQFDEVLCQDVLEHVSDLLIVMREIYRILKPGGVVRIRVPHFTSAIAFNDITHKHFFAWDSFNYFLKNDKYGFYVDFSFELLSRNIEFGKKFAVWNWFVEFVANRFPRFYEDTPLRVFPAMNIHFVLRKPN